MDDHEHEHDDGEHAYERAFGRVGGSFLGRTKSVGSASASGGGAGGTDGVGGGGSVFGWRGRGTSLGDGELGRRRSIQEGPASASSPTTNADNNVNADPSGVTGSGMRPRRVSFGWTGFGGGISSKTTSTPGPGSGSSSGSGSGGVPTVPKRDARPDGLPGTGSGGSGGLKVGRGRSGSGSAGTGGGKKRSVSPVSRVPGYDLSLWG